MNTQTEMMYPDRYAVQASLTSAFSEMLRRFPAMLLRAYQRSRQREVLARLSPRMLEDIGITESERLREVSKPFWSL